MEKEIHVKSYVKRDGTQVKEHYRTIDTNEKMYENPEPHFPEGEYPVVVAKNPNGGSKESNKGEILEKVLFGLGFMLTVAGEISRAIQSGSKLTKGMIQQFNIGISYLKQESAASDKRLHELLASMSNIHTQEEYSNLLKRISQEKQLGQYLNRKITIMNHAAQNNDYSTVVNELQNYQSDFDDVIKKTRQNRPLTTGIQSSLEYFKDPNDITGRLPIFDRGVLNIGTFGENIPNNIPDAKELWKASSHDFKHSKKYINKNGCLVYSIDDLPEMIQPIVRNKVKSQLKTDYALGVIFHHESSLAKAVNISPEIIEFFLKNFNDLISSKLINSSLRFYSSSNLQNSYGQADIINAYIDNDGNFNAIILDTWDFNPNENWIIKMGRNAQEAGIIRNYYTLLLIKIPFDIWYQWILFILNHQI